MCAYVYVCVCVRVSRLAEKQEECGTVGEMQKALLVVLDLKQGVTHIMAGLVQQMYS